MEEKNMMEKLENTLSAANTELLESAEIEGFSEASESEELTINYENSEPSEPAKPAENTESFDSLENSETSENSENTEEVQNLEEEHEDGALVYVEKEHFNVYDFDKTVLPYDSTAAFFIFCLKRQLSLIFAVIPAALSFPLFKLGIITKTRCKEIFYRFLTKLEDVDELVELFWRIKKRDFYPWYLSQKRSSDLIISASPDFLLRPICDELGVRLIASRVDKHTGKTEGLNNYGMEKLNRFRAEFPMAVIDEFYSDSLSDEPLAFIAKKAFFIKHGRPFPWPEHF